MSSHDKLRETILDLAKPLIEAQGLVLWGLDITPGGTLKATLFVEAPQSEDATGASIDQCEAISRQLSLAMDVEDCIDQPWTLEVSSPGLERKFFTLAQMRAHIGEVVEVRLNAPLAGRKRWLGKLLAVEADGFRLEPASISADGEVRPEGDPVFMAWNEVARASLVYIFQQPQKPGKQSSARKKK